jgi:hypothetical protein
MLRLNHFSPLWKGRRTWFINASNRTLAAMPFQAGMIGRSLRPQIRVRHEWSGVVTVSTNLDDLWASLVQWPTVQLHVGATALSEHRIQHNSRTRGLKY